MAHIFKDKEKVPGDIHSLNLLVCCSSHGCGVCVGLLLCGVGLVVLSSLAIISLSKRGLAVLLYLCCGRLFSFSFPRVAVCWSAVCDCGIF